MSTMGATFLCEGYSRTYAAVNNPELDFIPVRLTTDGTVVRIEPLYDHGAPPLTPKGWAQLAGSAECLVNDANRAWESMGAQEATK